MPSKWLGQNNKLSHCPEYKHFKYKELNLWPIIYNLTIRDTSLPTTAAY